MDENDFASLQRLPRPLELGVVGLVDTLLSFLGDGFPAFPASRKPGMLGFWMAFPSGRPWPSQERRSEQMWRPG